MHIFECHLYPIENGADHLHIHRAIDERIHRLGALLLTLPNVAEPPTHLVHCEHHFLLDAGPELVV